MPVRDLIYFADLLQEMFDKRIFYRQKIVRIPTPVFIVFYNGTQDMPDREEYRLSDQFEIATESPNLELKVNKVKRSMKVDIYFNFIGKYENDLDFKVKCNGQHKGFSSVVSLVRDDGMLEGLDEAVNS